MDLSQGITVLSLFDGMSCGMIALDRLGIKVKAYYASEIDKPAMKVSKHNWPNIIHIGDVTKVGYFEGWLYTENGTFYVGKIDLIIGGSPCQGFSFAGKQLNFEDPRSKLFFEFVRLRMETEAEYFMLENVVMKQEFEDIINKQLGVSPIFINSSLVSAQNRKRLYWTNIPYTNAPKDKNTILRDIVDFTIPFNSVSFTVNTNPSGNGMNGKIHSLDKKSPCLTTNKGEGFKISNKSQTILATIHKENAKSMVKRKKFGLLIGESAPDNSITYRKVSPIECERLQTVSDDYTITVSNTQRYRMLGNGWTVDVICHLFEPLLYVI